jgi:hypothetical protein
VGVYQGVCSAAAHRTRHFSANLAQWKSHGRVDDNLSDLNPAEKIIGACSELVGRSLVTSAGLLQFAWGSAVVIPEY